MHSVEKLFAVVDRKLDAFDFHIKKVKGKIIGNEYYAVSAEFIANGESFVKRVLTIGCPKGAIESITKDAMDVANRRPVEEPQATPLLRKVEAAPVAQEGITLVAHEDEENEEVAPGLRMISSEDEYTYEEDEEDEEEICEECGEPLSECSCEEPEITLTPSVGSTETRVPGLCSYCGAKVAPNFAYCPQCGGQQ